MQKGRVKSTTGLNLRDKPNGEKVAVLAHDQEFTIVDQVTFYRVKTRDGQTGYVHGSYVEKMPTFTDLPSEQAITVAEEEGSYLPDFKPVVFLDDHFVGESVTVDQDFVPELKRLSGFAQQCDLKIWVTSSLRPLNNQVRGAIVKPATNSCHHIGHAIDMNLFHQGKLYNSVALRKDNHGRLPQPLQTFFQLIREDEILRWGGDFRTQDPVHIDDDFFHKQKLFFQAKLNSRVDQANA